MKTIEVGPLLDEGRWTGYQKLLILGTALTIILDGVGNQLMGPIPGASARKAAHRTEHCPGARRALGVSCSEQTRPGGFPCHTKFRPLWRYRRLY
jgi:hypothetical protein